MKIRKLLAAGALCLLPICANAEVTDIKPDKNIGVYKQNEEILFTVTKADAAYENFNYDIQNMDGDTVLSGSVSSDSTSFDINIGIMKTGWYRMILRDSDGEVPIFASFTVLPSGGAVADNSPFSGMLVGQYGVESERKADFAEALKRVGINRVRDAALWCRGEGDYQALEENIDALYQAGNDQLLTVDLQRQIADEIGYNGDLFTVYKMYRDLSARFSDKVNAWEVINEPDIISSISGDIYSSYYKAAALGIENTSSDIIKSFGGMCNPISTFSDIMLQNGIMTYADYYNVHTHRNPSGNVYNAISGGLLESGKRMSALYGNNQPMWVTESGLRMPMDENELPSAKILKEQAVYLTTSFAESIGKYGTNNHFWFLMRHYIEEGREFGTASKNCMTYPAYLSFANLAYNLGEGKPIGEISARGNVSGYFFDTGSEDAAIVWKKTDGESYVQFDCSAPVKITDVLGDNKVIYASPVDGKVNIKVTPEPVIINFNGRTSEKNYCRKAFPEYEKQQRSNAQKVVIQQIWNTDSFDNGARVLKAGESYDVTCRVYNFNTSSRVTGKIEISADDKIEIVSSPNKETFILPKYNEANPTYASFSYTVRLKNDVGYYESGSIKFSGTAGEESLSPSVCGYVTDKDITVSDNEIKEFSNAYKKSAWDCGNRTAGSTCSVSTSGNSITFSLKFNGGDRCIYPYFETTVPAGSEGVVFDRTISDVGGGGVTQIFACTSGGMYLAEAGDFTAGTVRYVIPWNKFKPYGGADKDFDPSKIYRLMLGFNTYDDNPGAYTISHYGTFGSGYTNEKEEKITISGIENGKTYTKGNIPDITVNCDGTAELYINFKKFADVNPNEKISLSSIDSGACSVIAAIDDGFGHKEYKEINIYIRDYNDYTNKSALYLYN